MYGCNVYAGGCRWERARCCRMSIRYSYDMLLSLVLQKVVLRKMRLWTMAVVVKLPHLADASSSVGKRIPTIILVADKALKLSYHTWGIQ